MSMHKQKGKQSFGGRRRAILVLLSLIIGYLLHFPIFATYTSATVIVLANFPNAQSSIRPRCLDAFLEEVLGSGQRSCEGLRA